jgi:hypothetical protein
MGRSKYRRALTVGAALLLMTGCASQPAYIATCPVAPVYSRAFEAQAANELAFLPPNSNIATMILDYGKVRKEIIQCEKGG